MQSDLKFIQLRVPQVALTTWSSGRWETALWCCCGPLRCMKAGGLSSAICWKSVRVTSQRAGLLWIKSQSLTHIIRWEMYAHVLTQQSLMSAAVWAINPTIHKHKFLKYIFSQVNDWLLSRGIQVTGLQAGETYRLRVSAVNECGVGRASLPSEAVTVRTRPGQSARRACSSVSTLSWSGSWRRGRLSQLSLGKC